MNQLWLLNAIDPLPRRPNVLFYDPQLHVRWASEIVELGGRRQEGLDAISDMTHHIGVCGRPASSRDGEEKYSGWVSR